MKATIAVGIKVASRPDAEFDFCVVELPAA